MFSFLKKLWGAAAAVVKSYPAIAAWLLSVGVAFAGKFGLHLTPDQLLTFVGAVAAFLAGIVHNVTIPKDKLVGK